MKDLDNFLSKNQLFSTILNTIGDALIVTNGLGIVQFMNNLAEELTGWKQKESIGKPIDDIYNIITEERERPKEKSVHKVIRENKFIEFANHTLLIAKNGKKIPIIDRYSPIKDEEGDTIGVTLIFRDITEQKKVKSALKERIKELNGFYNLSAIMEKSDVTIKILMQKVVELILKSMQYPEIACAKIKFRDQEFTTKYFQETKWVLKSYIKVKGEIKGEFEVFYLEGITDFVEHPFFLEEERALLDAISERIGKITERIEYEQKLKDSKEAEYLGAYNRAEFYKDLFTHDINNILHNINSATELSEIYIKNPEKIKELNDIIKDQVIRGSKLVSNIRNLSKLEDEDISFRNIDGCTILKKSITYVKNSYRDKEITIQVDSVIRRFIIQANELLADVFENILNNAVKHNINPIVEIIIKISKKQQDDIDYLKIEFLDNGIGISEKRKNLVFQKGQTIRKGFHGLGIGLSLVKKVVETYKGKIWIQNRVKGDYSKGSNFVLLIPKAK